MDAKFGFDDNADFRQKEVFQLRDTTQEDAQEVEAAEVGHRASIYVGFLVTAEYPVRS
jgi:succinyl-CoA synthetase beta subunit